MDRRRDLMPRGWRLLILAGALIPLICASPAVGQQRGKAAGTSPSSPDPKSASSEVKTLANIHIESNLVAAPVAVRDSEGNYVQNLNESDFEILDNGVPQSITQFGLATQPIALVILIQTNQTVEPLLYQVRPLGSLFSGLFTGAKGQAAVLTFDDKTRVLQNFTRDPNALGQALKRVAAGGVRARLNDALARAIVMLSTQPKTDRRDILVFSEGFNRGSETSRGEIIRAATAAGVAIYGVRFEPLNALLKNKQEPPAPDPIDNNMGRPGPPGMPQTPGNTQTYWSTPINGLPLITDALNAARAVRLKDLVTTYSKYTGGLAFENWKKSSLQDQLQRIALDINSQYMLAYAPSTLNQPGFHRLRIVVREPGLRVRARAGYFYTTTASKP